MPLNTPIAFIIFNRPDLTRRVFAAIAEAKPKKLLVVADGPRFPDEVEKCRQARSVIARVDWDCELLTNFSDINMGCKLRVSSGLDWVFSLVDEVIVLEDDCLPHPSFFPYCAELLGKYRDCENVTAITGCNFQDGQNKTPYSYFFSRYLHVWGWASWRRAWKHYDVEMRQWPSLRGTSWLGGIQADGVSNQYWTGIFDRVAAGEIDTWDYQWLFTSWILNGLAIQPCANLISNIGFGEEATHTQGVSIYADLPVAEVDFPLAHPPRIERNDAADSYTAQRMFTGNLGKDRPPLYNRLIRRIRKGLFSSPKRTPATLRPS